MSDSKTKKAKSLRQSEISRMSELHAAAQKAQEDPACRVDFELRYTDVERIKEDFFKQHNILIGNLDDEDIDEFKVQDQIRNQFETHYWFIKTTYFQLINTTASNSSSSRNPSSSGSSNINVTLPKIEIPCFSGNITQFSTFKDMFDALIHKNSSLSNIEKFNKSS